MKNFTNILKVFTSKGFLTLLFTLLFLVGFTVFASINFPSDKPTGETTGGIFTKYFNNIFSDCGNGKALQGYDVNKEPVCVLYSYSCTGTLITTNATVTNTGGLSIETTYQNTNSSNPCYYTCNTNYSGVNCETYTPPVVTCTSFTYSSWGTCQSNNTQTRSIISKNPIGCSGGTPITSQPCTYIPPVICGVDLYKTAGGTCIAVGNGYYSPGNNDLRFMCQNHQSTSSRLYTYTSSGGGTNNCSATYVPRCGIDLYEGSFGSCNGMGTGYYSPGGNNTKYPCTNGPANSTYTGRGNGSNNCPFICNSGYIHVGNNCIPN